MTPEAKRAAAEYARNWRRRNPERAKMIKERYWERKARQCNEKAEVGKNID